MTSLVLHWLNEELALHRKVLVLERDLSNGYILAEILHVHGFENHLERYTDSSEIATRVNNIELLAKTMAAAGLGELSLSTRRAVMMEDRSAILQLLLQIKESLKTRGKRLSTEQKLLENVASRVYEPVRDKSGEPGVQDVEERFVRETAHRYHPKERRFYKEVNSAVHLRKFPQAQWTKENEQWEYVERMKDQQKQESAATRSALRNHLTEKRDFMKQWDKERLLKWQQTQDKDVAAEGYDLRLELTLEERKRRLHDFKIAAIQRDARGGVVEFEKNMNRLGLGGSATNGGGPEPPLRAIASTDPGAVAHLERLEKRVEDFAFRPSNNVQMMKELRARRKAQLAAEKDRRMRRMRAAGDAIKVESNGGNSMATELEGVSTPASPPASSAGEDVTEQVNAHQFFLDKNRDVLEANYDRLRVIGSEKRSANMEELERLRVEKRTSSHRRHRELCADIVDSLIDMIFSPTSSGAYDNGISLDTLLDEEAQGLTESFVNHSGVWKAYVRTTTTSRPKLSPLSHRLELFIREAVAADSTHLITPSWSLSEFKIVSLLTSDEQGHALARRVASEHQMQYVSVEELLDECVKYSYDPVKQAEHAATLSERERELGLFGPKVSAFRQKNSPVPDALAVEILVVAVQIARHESIEVPEAALDGGELGPQQRGCLLHNFPRSAEDWKLFEKAMMMAQPIEEGADDSVRAPQLAALEAVSIANESCDYVSCIDVTVILSAFPSLTPDVSGSSLPEPTSAEQRRSSAIAPEPVESPKRQSVVDPSIALKAEEAKEAQRKRLQVEELMSRTSCVVGVDASEIDERVVAEIVHLAISVYTTSEAIDRKRVQCDSSIQLPGILEAARQKMRAEMPLLVQIAWMVASRELCVDERSLMELVLTLKSYEHRLEANLRRLFREALATLQRTTDSTRSRDFDLDDILGGVDADCVSILRRGEQQLKRTDCNRDKSITATEVALGDAVEHYRKHAIGYIKQVADEAVPASLHHVMRWLTVVPLVCLEVKEFAADTTSLLRTRFYPQFPFLEFEKDRTHPLMGLSDECEGLQDAVTSLDQLCEERSLGCKLRPDVTRLAYQLATPDTSDSVVSRPHHELADTVLVRELAKSAIEEMVMVTRWSTALLDTVSATHAQDVTSLASYLQRDVRRSNESIGRVVTSLSQTGTASWPLVGGEHQVEQATRQEQAAYLSVEQLDRLIEACRATEVSSTTNYCLAQGVFMSAVISTARQHHFSDVWQDSTAVARVAMAWSDPTTSLVRWRHLVFCLLCTQFIGYPSTESILCAVDDIKRLIEANAASITRRDFESRVTLWFERDGSGSKAKYKSLLLALFSTDDRVEITPMVLTWCSAPDFPRRVRADVAAATLPSYSRGLRRAFTCLMRLTSAVDLSLDHFKTLLAITGTATDDSRLQQGDESHTAAIHWRAHEANDFLGFCDEHDVSIARWFRERDTIAVLLDTNERY